MPTDVSLLKSRTFLEPRDRTIVRANMFRLHTALAASNNIDVRLRSYCSDGKDDRKTILF